MLSPGYASALTALAGDSDEVGWGRDWGWGQGWVAEDGKGAEEGLRKGPRMGAEEGS